LDFGTGILQVDWELVVLLHQTFSSPLQATDKPRTFLFTIMMLFFV